MEQQNAGASNKMRAKVRGSVPLPRRPAEWDDYNRSERVL